ncbi:MAG: GHKL domain-containing protein [Clostridium sp.]|uniref:sensor histidine kinase n=1 Tax=Clostridium sp. TaxID=1506 RepID=UPI002A749B93|nr:GHKL domain-containing protein [Clostridium sp.]MDY2632812.1 GHKL domain-containing protein [Clostridium sp.]
MIILHVLEGITNLLSSIMIIYFFNTIMEPKIKKYSKAFTIIMIIFYASMSTININKVFIHMSGIKIIRFMLFYYSLLIIYPLLFRKGRVSEKFFLSSLYITIMVVSSFIIYIIVSMLFNITFSEMFLYTNYKRVIVVLFIRLFQFVLIWFFLNNINFIKYIKDITLYIVAAILLFNHILIFIIERALIVNINTVNKDTITILFSLCSIQILAIYILNIFSKEMEEKFILKMDLDRKIHDKEIIDMYTEMIGWKHDFRNHISMISALLQVSTKEDVISYIEEIDSSISKLDKNIYTDNIAINSILVSKIKAAEGKNINISLNLKINSDIKVSSVDICTILGNLLDNSIEACDNIKDYRFINLKIVSEKNILVIKISNNTSSGYVNKIDGKFISSKNSYMNGIGLVQVDNIVKKYKGYVNRHHKKNIFTTYVLIQQDEKIS